MNEISDDTKIYRIFSWPDLINTLHQEKVRLSQASNMADKNELFGIYFDLIVSIFGAQSSDDIPKMQRNFRLAQTHHYITCWTQTKDNIAVWSLYSPNHDGIQVCTTYGLLKSSIEQHWKKYPTARAYSLEPGDPRDLFDMPTTGPVAYVDFDEEYLKIRDNLEKFFRIRKQSFKDQFETYGPKNETSLVDGLEEARATLEKSGHNEMRENAKAQEITGDLMKDRRYSHEQEVRFILSLYRRDARTKAEYEAHQMAGLDGPYRHPPTK